MTGAKLLRCAGRALAAALVVLALAAPPADARTQRSFGERLVVSPSDVADGNALSNIFLNTQVSTFVFKRGTYDLGGISAFVFGREGITICGQTGRAGDVVFTSSSAETIVVDHSRDVLFRDLTIRSTATLGQAVRLSGFRGISESLADDTTFRGCTLEGQIGINATVLVDGLTVDRCTIRVLQANGVGIGWQDGEGLFVSKTSFRADDGVGAAAAVRVVGPLSAVSDGNRARTIVLANNSVRGDFAYGFDLIDVTDVRVRKNDIRFGGPTQGVAATGRVGIWVRRLTAADVPDDVELLRNRVRKALFGARLDLVDNVELTRNDFRRCGSPDTSNSLGLEGGAVLVSLTSSRCSFVRNDFRGLRSPTSVPAVVESGGADLTACFPADGRNRTDRGRSLFTGEQP